MTFFSHPLITPEKLEKIYPFSPYHKQRILKTRKEGENILKNSDERFIIFAGPCSIHNQQIALDYGAKLKALYEKVKDRLFLIMRVFLEKPRTQFGWKGYLYDPNLDGTSEIDEGLIASRKLLLNLMEYEIPLATEFLDPLLFSYHSDFFTWGIIGARTSASQIHRQMASILNFPIGFKNETDGTLDNAIYGALAARHPQTAIGIDTQGRICSLPSQGNPYTHLILRGSVCSPNYDFLSISQAIYKKRLLGLTAPIIVDCAHGNSEKIANNQIYVMHSILKQIIEGNHLIAGTMLESHLQGEHALSITDPCIDWEITEELVFNAYESLQPILNTK